MGNALGRGVHASGSLARELPLPDLALGSARPARGVPRRLTTRPDWLLGPAGVVAIGSLRLRGGRTPGSCIRRYGRRATPPSIGGLAAGCPILTCPRHDARLVA